jgi:hypothetical protein
MATTLKPEVEARIAALAERLALTAPDAHDRVLTMALDELDAKVPPPRRKMTSEEIAAEYRTLSAAGRRWREEHPDEYDEDQPPSKAWQEELYDEQGLPK